MVQKTKLKIALFFLGLFSIFSQISFITSCTLISNYAQEIIVKEIIDGDTFKDNSDKVYRILGVDTPETYDSNNNFKPTTGIQYFYGSLAKVFLINQLQNKKINIEIVKEDKYKRLVARMIIQNNNDIGSLLVKNGLAIVRYISNNKKSPFYYYDSSYINQLQKYQEEAKRNKYGFWAEINRLDEIYPK